MDHKEFANLFDEPTSTPYATLRFINTFVTEAEENPEDWRHYTIEDDSVPSPTLDLLDRFLDIHSRNKGNFYTDIHTEKPSQIFTMENSEATLLIGLYLNGIVMCKTKKPSGPRSWAFFVNKETASLWAYPNA